jgi:tetratricopeptide (TPR) repeat protein
MPSSKVNKLQNINDSLLTRQLYELSQTYLDLFLYENSVFYAEKLYCECQNEEVCYLLAKGYIGLGKFHQAYQILKDTKGHQCRYLFVIICIKLNKFIDAEKGILTKKLFGKGLSHKDLEEVVPQGAYGYYLYGNILEKLNRRNDAFQAYKKSLDIDPFMWCSFNKLCKIDPKKIDNNKYYSELNPKMLLFNKKVANILLNPENNINENKSNKIKNNIINNNFPLSNNISNNMFNMTSVDNSTNSLNSRENPINSVANFRISTASLNNNSINNNNISNEQMNKYRSILDFGQVNNNINSKIIVNTTENKNSTPENNNNKTPSIHKKSGEIDYEKNYLPQKKVNNPFVFSSTPNQVQLDFNNLSSSNANKLGSNIGGVNSGNNNASDLNNNGINSNKQKESNSNKNNPQETSFSYFNINFSNNNNKTSNNINNNELIKESKPFNNEISNNINQQNNNSNNRINPFNINNSGIFNGANTNINNNSNNSLFNNGGYNPNMNNLNNSFGLNFKLTPSHKMNSLFIQNNNSNSSNNNINNNSNNNLQVPKNNYLLNNIEISPDNKLHRGQQDNNNSNINNALFNFSSETNNPINSNAFPKSNNFIEYSEKDKNININIISNTNTNNNSLEFKNVTQLLNIFSEIIKKISNYDCAAALELLLKKIPQSQFKSCFVYTLIGRCYFELAKYKEAENYYNLSLLLDPSYLTGLEYFSSVLWHLKDQFKCCNLAHLCLEQCQFAPETWVVLGNTFSLQKEHETAIKFFNRATQINPAFAYSYTLAGHEYVDNENFTEANNCFKKALAFDERQVNAWWGLGNIQLKEQNYSEAIKLFKKCLSINNHSAVLHFYLGTAYLQNKDIKNALNNLIIAQNLDQKNPMIQYQVANIYMNQGKNEEALKILKDLEENMPKEAPIYISIGKIYKNKKEYKKALDYFNKAIDLDPKDSNLAKTLIERLQIDNGSV